MLTFDQVSSWQQIGFKRNNKKCIFYNAVMSRITSQILKFADSWKTKKSKYLENKTQFLPLTVKKIN